MERQRMAASPFQKVPFTFPASPARKVSVYDGWRIE
jgi:hypothetical protein